MFDVITVGSATIDIFAYTDKNLFLCIDGNRKGKQCYISYPAGEKILLSKIDYTVGGGGTNTAVSFSRLGFRTAYLGHIGLDSEGTRVVDELSKEGIPFIGTRGKQKTNTSIVLDSFGHDRTLLIYKEASDFLDFNQLNKEQLKARWFYFSSMIGKSFTATESIAALAKKNRIKVAFNPSEYQACKGKKALKRMLDCTDALILNKQEAQFLLKTRSEDVAALLKGLSSCGRKISVVGITDGRNGADVYDGRFVYHLDAAKSLKIVETTGAGDAFASTFIAGLMMRLPIEKALKLGMVNAESVIMHHGAKNKLLSRKEILALMKKDKRVVKKRKI